MGMQNVTRCAGVRYGHAPPSVAVEALLKYPATYVRLLARELRLDAAGQTLLLAGTSLVPADLAVLDQTISQPDQIRIVGNALRLAGRADFGLEMATRMPVAAHGPLGSLLSAAPTLLEAWAAMARYHALRIPGVQLSRAFAGEHMAIRIELQLPLDAIGLFCIEAMAVTVQRSIELVIGRRLREAEIRFAYPAPAHAEAYARYFNSPYVFDAEETVVRVPLKLLEQPNPFRDSAAYEQALRQCEQLEQAQRQSGGWGQRITRLLQQHPGQLWSLASMADHHGLSPRTLMRYLKAEGSSYQALLDAELARQAEAHFSSGRHTVESVALALGYHDATAFRRAFQRWFGMSPSAWLRQRNG